MIQFQTIKEHEIGKGIDLRSSENSIPAGFFKDLINCDVVFNRVRKRSGHQQEGSYIPVRATQLNYSEGAEDNLEITFDTSIDLTNLKNSPIIVKGKTSNSNTLDEGSFPTDSEVVKYYTGFKADPRVNFDAGTTSVTIDQSAHGLDISNIFVGTSESTDASTFSNSYFLPDSITIDTITKDIDINYNAVTSFEGFVYFANPDQLDSTYVSTTTSILPSSTGTISISENTHNLDTFNIVSKLYIDNGTSLEEVLPDNTTLNQSTGEISFEVTNSSGTTIDVFVVLVSVSPSSQVTGTVGSGSTETVTIPNAADVKFPFMNIYLEPTPGADLEQVLPESIIYDDSTENLEITFVNGSGSSANFTIYYFGGYLLANKITLTDDNTVTSGFIDNDAQVTVYGLDHCSIYSESDKRQGWSNHIDAYKRTGEERLITGLGGNLFSLFLNSELPSTELLPTYYSRLNNRAANDVTVGPLFNGLTDSPSRTRGYIKSEGAETSFLTVETITYNETSNRSEYILNAPLHQVLDSNGASTALSSIISTDTNMEDYLTIQDAGNVLHNGTFRIVEVSVVDANTLKIEVDNPTLDCVDFNEVDSGALAGVFTDQIPLFETSEFIPGDILVSQIFDESSLIRVITSSASTVVVSGVVQEYNVPSGLRTQGKRTSNLIPLRTGADIATVSNLTKGDILAINGYDRKFKVKSVQLQGNETVSIVPDGEKAIVTVLDTSYFEEGESVVINAAGVYSGVHVISEIISSTSFAFLTTESDTETGLLISNLVEIDESITFSDDSSNSNTVYVDSRWIPIEAPSDSYELTESTYNNHFTSNAYDNQDFLRSTMVNDNMYFTNGSDEVMKFDGQNIYRAGLFTWQPGVFVSLDNSVPGKIVTNNPSEDLDGTFYEDNRFFIASGTEFKFLVGDRIRHTQGVEINDYIIEDIEDGQLIVNKNIEGLAAASTVTKLSTYRYYFRLNAVDANNNIIASAVTGAEDFRVDVAENTAIELKLVGMPVWGIYDYKRLEVEIYRTVKDTELPFYRIANIPMKFDSDNGYIIYSDSTQDEELRDLDITASVESDVSIRSNWSEPLRAKYVTSSGNRLVLANLVDYPEIDMQLFDQSNLVSNADLNGKMFKLRKNNTNTGDITSTDMLNTARYELIDSASAASLTIGSVSLSGSEVTVDVGAHTLVPGNWIYVYNETKTASNSTRYIGWHQITSVSGTEVTFREADDATTGTATKIVTATDPNDIPVLIGSDGNRDTRADANAQILKPISSAIARLAEAVNCSMRVCQTENFEPWIIAKAGDSYEAGQIILRYPRADGNFPETIAVDGEGQFDVFVNGLRRDAGSEVSATEKLFTSRIVQSYPNFPEIFENPRSVTSTSNVRDINSSDGQPITSVISFFGESTTQQSNSESSVMVFKTSSIYLYNASNFTDPQKLDTQGLGCTAPFSVSYTKDGVMFANASGLYCITSSLRFRYIGEKMERFWLENVNQDRLDLVQGHNFGTKRQYKLSVPLTGNSSNSDVMVYDHSNETLDTPGAWTRYDSHASTGWANLTNNAFFSTTKGRVYGLRKTGSQTDFRDDDQAIECTIDSRSMDFGDSGARKTLISIISHFRNLSDSDSSSLAVSTENEDTYYDTDAFVLDFADANTGIADVNNQSIVSIRSSVDRRKFLYISVRYQNTGKDEPFELTGMDFRVSLLSQKGIKEAADT